MAKNRTETKSEINLVFQPVLEIADHRTYLNAQADDVKFRKDVIQTQTAVSGAETIDFSGKDTYVFNASAFGGSAITLTCSNLDNGDEKYLIVTKNVNQIISFSNVSDLTEYPARLAPLTTLLFRIIQKNAVNYAELLSNTVATRPWTNTTIFGSASSGSRYRLDEFGYLEIRVSFRNDTGAKGISEALFTLPAEFRPVSWNYSMDTNISNFSLGQQFRGVVSISYSTGEVFINLIGDNNIAVGLPNNTDIAFYLRIPLTIS